MSDGGRRAAALRVVWDAQQEALTSLRERSSRGEVRATIADLGLRYDLAGVHEFAYACLSLASEALDAAGDTRRGQLLDVWQMALDVSRMEEDR